MKIVKGQSAIEYLMTYGWMLLVVAIAGGTVFSVVQGQSIESVNGFSTQDLAIEDFGVYNGGLMFAVDSPAASSKITGIEVKGDSGTISYKDENTISSSKAVHIPGVVSGSTSKGVEVEISYDYEGLENITTTGTIVGNLDVDPYYDNRTMILDGLVGLYPLREDYSSSTGVFDISQERLPNEANGVELTEDSAIFEDGDNIFSEEAVHVSEKFTGIVAVKPYNTSRRTTVFSNRGSGRNYQLEIQDGGDIRMTAQPESCSGWTGRNSDLSVSENEWAFVAVTHSSDRGTTFFVNDSKQSFDNDAVLCTNEDMVFRIANGAGIGMEEYQGEMRDIMLFDRVLTDDEINRLYQDFENNVN